MILVPSLIDRLSGRIEYAASVIIVCCANRWSRPTIANLFFFRHCCLKKKNNRKREEERDRQQEEQKKKKNLVWSTNPILPAHHTNDIFVLFYTYYNTIIILNKVITKVPETFYQSVEECHNSVM